VGASCAERSAKYESRRRSVNTFICSNPILTYNQAFNPVVSTTNPSSNWLAPQSTLQPRFFKFSAQIDF
jgi:hypothetical protein